MELSTWRFMKPYTDRRILIEDQKTSLHISFRDECYTVLNCYLDAKDLKSCYYYKLDAVLDVSGLDYRFFYICVASDGTELCKGHIKLGERFLVPEGCCSVTVQFLLFSHHPGTARLNRVTLTEQGPYVSRTVRVCSVAWDMAAGGKRRTFLENVDDVMAELDAVSVHHPDIVTLTEAVFQTGRDQERQPEILYNHLDDQYISQLCEKARHHQMYIACSIQERDAVGLKRLSGLLINRSGEIQNIYHKTHLTMGELEDGCILENELPVFQTDFGTVGILICWDHFFPEAVRALVLKGAELLLIPTHGFLKERLITRAVENGVYVASAYTYSEGTMIVAPNGKILDSAAEKGYAFAEIDLNKPVWRQWLSCDSFAEPNPTYLMERRPELYGILGTQMDMY